MSNQVIYKWRLEITDQQELQLPEGAEILCVQLQYGEPRLWALVHLEITIEQKKGACNTVYVCVNADTLAARLAAAKETK